MRKFVLCGLILLMMSAAVMPVTVAQRPDAPTYALRGAYPVGTMEFVIEDDERELKGTVWYPALNPDELPEEVTYQELLARVEGHALRDAEPNREDAPYPLVIFSHGLGGFRFQSVFLMEHLASYGFIVIATEHPGSTVIDVIQEKMTEESIVQNFALRPLDVLRVINYADTSLNSAGGALEGLIDLDQIAMMGHSFGGYTALAAAGGQLDTRLMESFCLTDAESCPTNFPQIIADTRQIDFIPIDLFPATTDPRIRSMVLLAPWGGDVFSAEGLADVTVPALIIVGSKDLSTPAETNAYPFFENISSDEKSIVTFENAGHYIYVEECTDQMISFGYYDHCSDLVWEMQRAHDLINHFVTAFLLGTLKEDNTARVALDAEMIDFTGIVYEHK